MTYQAKKGRSVLYQSKRSLYQCLHAKVSGGRIRCSKGHPIGRATDGTLPLVSLHRGAALERTICQLCPDYNEMGPPVPKKERGWAGMEKGEEK